MLIGWLDPIIEIVLLAISIALIVVSVPMIKRGLRVRREGNLPHCRHCEYLLIGINPDRCPECGTPLEIVYGERSRRLAVSFAGGAVLLLVGLTMLVALASIRFKGSIIHVPEVTAAQDITNLKLALDAFQIDCGRFPTNSEGLAALVKAPAGVQGWAGPYIDVVPFDPWGRAYIYRSPGSKGKNYDLISAGPDGIPGTKDDITN